VSAAAPASVFSAERAWHHLEAIAAAPHPHGSAAHDSVRDYLVRSLEAIGVVPRLAVTARTVRDRNGVEHELVLRNVVGGLAGTNPSGTVALVTHYDSHRRASGAGDAGLAVAALLETARALRARPPLRNDLLFLFTDAEELGLLGARSFVDDDDAAADVRVVLNFEGRGSRGPALMFETGPGNAALVRTFQRAAPRPIGSSIFPEAYRYLPNDTDFTVFLRAGVRGLNFAHIDGAETYHRETDIPANASAATLQHHGDQALAMALAFGTLDLGTLPGADGPRGGDAIYFNAPGLGLVRYPAGLAVAHAAAVLVLLVLAVALARRRCVLRPAGVAAGFLLSIVVLLVGTAAAWAAGLIAGMEAEAGSLAGKLVVREGPYMLAIVAVAVAAVIGPVALLAPRFGTGALALGVLIMPALVGAAVAVLAPGASYLLLWPALFAIAAAYVIARTPRLTLRDALLVTLLLAPAVALWTPHLSLFLTGLTVVLAPALGVVAALAAMSLAPAAALIRR
jgi:hypothetical protein